MGSKLVVRQTAKTQCTETDGKDETQSFLREHGDKSNLFDIVEAFERPISLVVDIHVFIQV